MNYAELSSHLPYLHFYVIFAAAILFIFIGATCSVTRTGTNSKEAVNLEKTTGKRPRTIHHFTLFLIAELSIIVAIYLSFRFGGTIDQFIFNKWVDDNFFASYLSAISLAIAGFALAYAYESLSNSRRIVEFYILLFFALLGVMLMCYSMHMLFIYIGVELMSLSLYAMIALERESKQSIEASMKYFVLGAISSGLLLFGLSMVYGGTGSLYVWDFHKIITSGMVNEPLVIIGTIFIIASIAFKFGLVPFHQWVPDVYQGASYPASIMVAHISKLAIFAIMMRLVITSLYSMAEHWKVMILIIALASIVVGYYGVIVQQSFRRFLGYSSIANLGFVMLAMYSAVEIRSGTVVGTNTINAISADLFYLMVYQFTSLAAFAFAWVLSKNGIESDRLDDFKGLNQRYPWFAFMMAMLMLSMAGIPPLIGFWGKFLVIQALLMANLPTVVVFAVLTSLIGAYYYLRVIKLMYFDAPEPEQDAPIVLSKVFRMVLSIHGILLLMIAFLPGPLIQLIFLIMT